MSLKMFVGLIVAMALSAAVIGTASASNVTCDTPNNGINAVVVKEPSSPDVTVGKKVQVVVMVCTSVDVTIHVNAYQIPADTSQFLDTDFSLKAGKSMKLKYSFVAPEGASEVLYLFTATSLAFDNPYRYAQAVVDVNGIA